MNTHATILHPWRHRRLLPALLLSAAALLGAGCLPSAEDTLGEAPPGYIVAYTFDTGIVADFVISGNSSGGGWIIDNATGGSGSGAPSLSSGPFNPGVPDFYCIQTTVSENSSYVEFEYTFDSAAGSTFKFTIDAAEFTVATVDVLTWTKHEQSPASGPHTFKWCVDSPASVGPSTLHIDDIEIYP
jgi:hypothetical protein